MQGGASGLRLLVVRYSKDEQYDCYPRSIDNELRHSVMIFAAGTTPPYMRLWMQGHRPQRTASLLCAKRLIPVRPLRQRAERLFPSPTVPFFRSDEVSTPYAYSLLVLVPGAPYSNHSMTAGCVNSREGIAAHAKCPNQLKKEQCFLMT